MEKPSQINAVSLSADKQFKLTPCTDYVCTIGGTGAAQLQRWDGTAWCNDPASDGTVSQVFTFTTPPTGRINFDVTAGTVIVTCHPKAPTYIRNS